MEPTENNMMVRITLEVFERKFGEDKPNETKSVIELSGFEFAKCHRILDILAEPWMVPRMVLDNPIGFPDGGGDMSSKVYGR